MLDSSDVMIRVTLMPAWYSNSKTADRNTQAAVNTCDACTDICGFVDFKFCQKCYELQVQLF